MGESKLKHRLAALLSADVVGYSRLMYEDELSTVRTLAICRDKIKSLIHESGGRVVNFVGDNVLSECPGALDAVSSAVKIQRHTPPTWRVKPSKWRISPDCPI